MCQGEMPSFAQSSRKHPKSQQDQMKSMDHNSQLHTDRQLEENHREQNLLGKHEGRDLD